MSDKRQTGDPFAEVKTPAAKPTSGGVDIETPEETLERANVHEGVRQHGKDPEERVVTQTREVGDQSDR